MEAAGISYLSGLTPGVHENAEMFGDITPLRRYSRAELAQGARAAMFGDMKIASDISGLDVKMASFGGRTARQAYTDGTIMQILHDGVRMDGNTLLENWQALTDAARIDLTVRKMMNPTIRELIYDVIDRPNASATEKVDELYPYAAEFVENNGTGQAVEMMEMMGGQTDTITQRIYAAGMTYDLQKYLFDRTLDMTKVNDSIALAEGGKKDDTAIAPILSFTYSGVSGSQTAADSTGSTREEKLYNTISNAISAMEARRDPVTQSLISAQGCSILASPVNAGHIAQVLDGFAGVEVNVKKRPALSQVARVIGYEGARIVGRALSKTYTDVSSTKAYLIVPNRRMIVSVKRTLQLNIDPNPAVLRLSREQMAWYYVEGIYNDGIGYWVQEITLPTW